MRSSSAAECAAGRALEDRIADAHASGAKLVEEADQDQPAGQRPRPNSGMNPMAADTLRLIFSRYRASRPPTNADDRLVNDQHMNSSPTRAT